MAEARGTQSGHKAGMISLDSKPDRDDELGLQVSRLGEAWVQGLNEGSLGGMLFKLKPGMTWKTNRGRPREPAKQIVLAFKDLFSPIVPPVPDSSPKRSKSFLPRIRAGLGSTSWTFWSKLDYCSSSESGIMKTSGIQSPGLKTWTMTLKLTLKSGDRRK